MKKRIDEHMPLRLRPVAEADVLSFFHHSHEKRAIQIAMPARLPVDWVTFRREWDEILSDDKFMCRTAALGNEVVGYLAHFPQMGAPSISYWFGEQYWGRGLAQNALKLFLGEIRTRPIFARVAETNLASLRVLSSNGFKSIGKHSYFAATLGRDVSEILLRLES